MHLTTGMWVKGHIRLVARCPEVLLSPSFRPPSTLLFSHAILGQPSPTYWTRACSHCPIGLISRSCFGSCGDRTWYTNQRRELRHRAGESGSVDCMFILVRYEHIWYWPPLSLLNSFTLLFLFFRHSNSQSGASWYKSNLSRQHMTRQVHGRGSEPPCFPFIDNWDHPRMALLWVYPQLRCISHALPSCIWWQRHWSTLDLKIGCSHTMQLFLLSRISWATSG